MASVAYPAFLAIQQMDIGLSNIDCFATIGTGTGLDALAAIEVFGCREVVVTDMHEDVVNTAARNIAENILDNAPPVSIHVLTGDLLMPLRQVPGRFDLIYENLPNIPFHQGGNIQHEQTSSSFIGSRREEVPDFVNSNLLTLHYLAILQAKGCLADGAADGGAILSSIGARVPLRNLLRVSEIMGCQGSILIFTWKVQSEPEDIIGGYAAWQRRGLGQKSFCYSGLWNSADSRGS